MKFSSLYKIAISNWPEEIDISDGKPVGESGYLFPYLVKIHDEIENAIPLDDDWMQITDWAFYQAFHSESKILIKNGKNVLFTRDVKKAKVQSRLFQNLKSEEWKDLNEKYENDI